MPWDSFFFLYCVDLEDAKSEVTASSSKPEPDKAEAVSDDQSGSLIEADSDFQGSCVNAPLDFRTL